MGYMQVLRNGIQCLVKVLSFEASDCKSKVISIFENTSAFLQKEPEIPVQQYRTGFRPTLTPAYIVGLCTKAYVYSSQTDNIKCEDRDRRNKNQISV